MSEIHDDDNDIPMLSGSALEALKEFYAERDAKEKELENLKAKKNTGDILSMDTFTENWNDSQFWYSQETADIFARELLAKCDNKSRIAVISAPSAFVQLKNVIASTSMSADKIPEIYLFEFDERFSIFPEFIFYDYKFPLKLPRE
ncbi:hypothetical protein VE00_01615 [Pseudogymnoascus sp. WSF 3629]|nr:hypothetical protein VE00_01615 [Pseudogymnoascus sp. WSF 3629]